MDSYFNYFDGFGSGRDRRRNHPFGPGQPFGPHHHGGHGFPSFGPPGHESFGPFGPHGRREGFGPRGRGGFGPGGFGPWGPHRWGPKPQDSSSSSSSEDEEPKKPEEETSSDSSSSDSEVDCHRRGRHGHGHGHGGHDRRRRQRRGRGRRHCHGHDHHGRHGRHGFWPPHHHGRHGHWPPHHHHHHWDPRAQNGDEDLPVEDASGFGSDFQVIQDDVTTQMNNLQLQDDSPQDQSSKKCFKVALNADGFKVKDIRIRLHQNQLLVEGKQNAKTFLGTFQRSFAYTIKIPAGVNTKKIKTKLGPDGVLRIKAKKSREDTDNEEPQEIPIKE